MTTAHHPDCDGWRFEHRAAVERIYPNMFQATCRSCDWKGSLFGRDAQGSATAEANAHSQGFVECDGRCLAWQ